MASKGIKPKKAGAVEIDVSSCATIDDMHRCRDAILISVRAQANGES